MKPDRTREQHQFEQRSRDAYTAFVDTHSKHVGFRSYISTFGFGDFDLLKTDRFTAVCVEHLHSIAGHSAAWAMGKK
jgi:hypothetical protein